MRRHKLYKLYIKTSHHSYYCKTTRVISCLEPKGTLTRTISYTVWVLLALRETKWSLFCFWCEICESYGCENIIKFQQRKERVHSFTIMELPVFENVYVAPFFLEMALEEKELKPRRGNISAGKVPMFGKTCCSCTMQDSRCHHNSYCWNNI